jgi:hypothetical protein
LAEVAQAVTIGPAVVAVAELYSITPIRLVMVLVFQSQWLPVALAAVLKLLDQTAVTVYLDQLQPKEAVEEDLGLIALPAH